MFSKLMFENDVFYLPQGTWTIEREQLKSVRRVPSGRALIITALFIVCLYIVFIKWYAPCWNYSNKCHKDLISMQRHVSSRSGF